MVYRSYDCDYVDEAAEWTEAILGIEAACEGVDCTE